MGWYNKNVCQQIPREVKKWKGRNGKPWAENLQGSGWATGKPVGNHGRTLIRSQNHINYITHKKNQLFCNNHQCINGRETCQRFYHMTKILILTFKELGCNHETKISFFFFLSFFLSFFFFFFFSFFFLK